MAIYHLSVKTISRSAGRSVTAAAAYRSSEKIVDERTGEIHDYTHKKGVLSTDIILPKDAPVWAKERKALWNAAEQSETRKNSTVGREFEIALPAELDAAQRRQLAIALAEEIVARHQCVADVAIHEPGSGGDNRNHHAHVLCSTRRLGPNGFYEKTRELDDVKQGEVVRWRERFAQIQNRHLRAAGHQERVDHRSLEDQGIKRTPTFHLGPAATNFERRTGRLSRRRQELDQEFGNQLCYTSLRGQLQRESARFKHSIFGISSGLGTSPKKRTELHHQTAEDSSTLPATPEQHQQQKANKARQLVAAYKARQLAKLHKQTDTRQQVDFERENQELDQTMKTIKKDIDRGGPGR